MRFFRYLFLNLKATAFRLIQAICVTLRYYPRLKFFAIDITLLGHYFLSSPYRISKSFLKELGAQEIYAYGDTPLTTLDYIARECSILSEDVVYDLGCGTGRTCFWLKEFTRCQVVGIDFLPTFIKRAQRISRLWDTPIEFREEDMTQIDFKAASVVYLYGICLEEAVIVKLVKALEGLSARSRVISVSYSLTDYSPHFYVEKSFKVRYPWGRATVYLNCKVDESHRVASVETGRESSQCFSSSL